MINNDFFHLIVTSAVHLNVSVFCNLLVESLHRRVDQGLAEDDEAF